MKKLKFHSDIQSKPNWCSLTNYFNNMVLFPIVDEFLEFNSIKKKELILT